MFAATLATLVVLPFALAAEVVGTARAESPPVEVEVVLPTVTFDGVATPDMPHFDLEVLYHRNEHAKGLEIARARLAADPDDVHLYIHVLRFMFELGEEFDRTDPSIDKKAWYTEMIAIGDAGRERFPDDMHLLFGYTIAKARLGTTRGVLSSLFMAKEIEQNLLQIVDSGYRFSSLGGEEMVPCDPMLTLGIFYRMVPDSWIVKLLSGTRGSLDKSLAFLQRSDACYGNRNGVVKELGVTQLCIGTTRKDEHLIGAGRATLERLRALPLRSRKDAIDHRHAGMLIDDPSLACEYSRDGQQDLDQAQLEQGN